LRHFEVGVVVDCGGSGVNVDVDVDEVSGVGLSLVNDLKRRRVLDV
jgi:hypothetical protein